MAAPNLLALTTATPSTATIELTSSSEFQIVSNAAASGMSYKINSIIVANTDTNVHMITVAYHSSAAIGGTAFPLASAISIPANTSLVVVQKDSQIYIPENASIGATADAGNYLYVTCSYEVLS